MKIYYAHSIRGQHQEGEWTPGEVILHLKSLGHDVLSEEIWTTSQKLTDIEIYHRDTEMIRACDIVFANVTNASLGVGYEIGYAEVLGKKIICFYQSALVNSISAMIVGNGSIITCSVGELSDINSIISS